jgi:hypothetical protein
MNEHPGPASTEVDFATRHRGGLSLRAETLTWQHALFAVEREGRVVYLLREQRDVREFLDAFEAGRLDAELRQLLDHPPRRRLTRRRVRRGSTPAATGALIGLEHEFSIFDGDTQIDFRQRIHTLPIAGVRADPSDPNAYRCPWGGVITCDGREAEIAVPPVVVGPGFASETIGHAERGEAELYVLLPEPRFEGYSTHVSVSLHERRDRQLARRYAQTFAPALMLLMDRSTSPGLLVRPRPGRLELCGEHVSGEVARGVVAFAAGSVRALVRADRRALRELDVDVRTEPARERYGLYVDRRAFGPDLYAAGRAAELRESGRGSVRSAQAQLESAWALARSMLADDPRADDLDAADRMVSGDVPLPSESDR